jgi:6-phospho-beta-glucosidase
VVEIPCSVSSRGPVPDAVGELPAAEAALVARVHEVERTTLAAAEKGSRSLALDAIAAHPVVPSRAVAEKILDGYMAAFDDLARRLR